MVLAASTRRGGQSLAGIARSEIGHGRRDRGGDRDPLHRSIIALAGLGIVVVKALGGEEVPMKAGTVAGLSREGDDLAKTIDSGRPVVYDVPPGADLSIRQTRRRVDGLPRAVPARRARRTRSTRLADGKRLVLPEEARRLVPGSSWGTFTIACTIPIALFVGWYMYRFRKGKVVEASLDRRGGRAGGDGRRGVDPRLGARALLLAVARPDDLRHRRLRLRRLGPAGLAPASARATTSRAS